MQVPVGTLGGHRRRQEEGSMELSPEQREHYWTKGWLVVEGVVAPEVADRIAQRALEIGQSQLTAESTRYQADRAADGSDMQPRKLDSPFAVDQSLGRPLLKSPLRNLIRQLIGVQPLFFSDQIFFKPPRHGSAKHYHQDNAYFHMQPADHAITGWVALDDVDEENGCLRYIDGSHLGPILDAKPVPGQEYDLMPDPADIDLSKESLAPVRKGGVVFHHSQVLHGSAANTSDRWRRGYATHWVAADVTTPTGLLDTAYFHRPELFR
jgi:ectoine hydroxylase-related dioxygenase (phytanoyl-CoA dioxygenase family)